MADRVNILAACRDRLLFASWFKDTRPWANWFVFLKAAFALPLAASEGEIFQQFTGRQQPPRRQVREAWLICGRRAGKTFITALGAVYLACFRDYSPYLAPGERGVVMLLAADRKQARVLLRYVMGFLNNVAMLKRMVRAERAEGIELSNGIDIEIHTASYKSVRGYTVVAALCDEVAFWPTDDSATPAAEILNALRPAMATIPNAMLIVLSSPYGRSGPLWDTYRDHFGSDSDDVLVWQADTRSMNPTVPQGFIDRAYADDPISAAAEYGAQFRSDVDKFLSPEWVDRAIAPGRSELPPMAGRRYVAFADPSGGGADSFTLAIAHLDSDRTAVLDALRSRRPPFDPKAVVAEFAALMKTYGITTLTGDRYAGEWVVAAFRDEGLRYLHCERSKSELYLEIEPAFAQGAVSLLDLRPLHLELLQLERRTASGGRDRVDHPPRGHDDQANAACGALWLARSERAPVLLNDQTVWVATREDREEATRDWAERHEYFPPY